MFDYLKRTCRKHFGKDREFYAVVHNLLGITPDNIDLYKLALIHRSASVMLPDGNPANNERLEFLGDAVLETIVSDFLFIEYPEQTEGFLTQMRSRIVSRASLDDISSRMGIDKYIVANFNGTYSHKHLNGNAFEALVGAVYLDKGYDFANRFVINGVLRRYVDLSDITTTEVDFKSRLIEWCQKSKRSIHFNTASDEESTMRNPPVPLENHHRRHRTGPRNGQLQKGGGTESRMGRHPDSGQRRHRRLLHGHHRHEFRTIHLRRWKS